MALSRKDVEIELEAAKAAIKAHKIGVEINGIVLAAMENELRKYPKEK